MDSQRIIVPLPNGLNIVAESSVNPDYPYEIYVGILREDGVWYQDLAVVRSPYHYEDGFPVYEEDRFEVLVYGDENDEDYTNKFNIDLNHGGI